MRTFILRLVDPRVTGSQLHGLVQQLGHEPVPFAGNQTLLEMLRQALLDAGDDPHLDEGEEPGPAT